MSRFHKQAVEYAVLQQRLDRFGHIGLFETINEYWTVLTNLIYYNLIRIVLSKPRG